MGRLACHCYTGLKSVLNNVTHGLEWEAADLSGRFDADPVLSGNECLCFCPWDSPGSSLFAGLL